jgi:mannosylglycerate hydrolase
MKANNIIVVSETHWDREWYLPFQEFRVKLIKMMDNVIEILQQNPRYKSFTLDGQTIILEDYLEIKPNEKLKIKNLIQKRRLIIGPLYVMPDEFLVSGESIIRNLLIGIQMAKKFGGVMKVGYFPDPFGHIAQLPQILQGFEIPAVLFWRGLGNQLLENHLSLEFIWNAPGNVANVLASLMKLSYGSVAGLDTRKKEGIFKKALHTLNWAISKLEPFAATPIILLNNGTDHSLANPKLPEIIGQWNEFHPDKPMLLGDFEEYIEKIMVYKEKLKSYQGELRGSKYIHLLSGVLSSRIWIKQLNSRIEHLFERYVEPLTTINWLLNDDKSITYPKELILNGYKWLIKNHPHDSISGCSIDPVYEEMKIRYQWAEQIGLEVLRTSLVQLDKLIQLKSDSLNSIHLIIFNPLPWNRKDIVQFNILTELKRVGNKARSSFDIYDSNDKKINCQVEDIVEVPRFRHTSSKSYKCSFLGEVPACGYQIYYLKPHKKGSLVDFKVKKITSNTSSIENQYYKIKVGETGEIAIFDKASEKWYRNLSIIEDIGDWGDLYDYSGPKKFQNDKIFSTKEITPLKILTTSNGRISKTIQIEYDFKLPQSLSNDRQNRENYLVSNPISISITLHHCIKRVNIKVKVENNSKDHKLRILFPTSIKTNEVKSDDHFYVISHFVNLPEGSGWNQKPSTTKYNNKFVAVNDAVKMFAILNKGLSEYEAFINNDGSITIGITLLRCVEWLSRYDLETRDINAGPDLQTPSAQCIGTYFFELSLVIDNNTQMLETIHNSSLEFTNPLMALCPAMIQTNLGTHDRVILAPLGILYPYHITKNVTGKQLLPPQFSFLSINNKAIILSIIKKAEQDNDVVARVYNLSSQTQLAQLSFYSGLKVIGVKIVNLLEEDPINMIKAKINSVDDNLIEIQLDPHVIATIKIQFQLNFEKYS